YAALVDVYHNRTTRVPVEGDDSFRTWSSGGHTNLAAKVADRVNRETTCAPGDLQAALRTLCWESFRYAGTALSAAMGVGRIKAQATGRMTERDESLLRLVYAGDPAFGGLPLALLFDRFDLLGPWIEAELVRPGSPDLSVFYTLLSYFAAMAREKREA